MTLDLARRIAFTLGALLVYRLGAHIPLPGLDLGGLRQAPMFSDGGALVRLGLFSLSILPYVTSAIVVQLMTVASPALAAFRRDGERGRRMIEFYTRSGAVILTVLQAYGIAIGLEGAGPLVPEPGALFRFTTVLTLTGGVLFLMWLSEQITLRGIGNGIALILLAGWVSRLLPTIAGALELVRQGAVVPGSLLVVVVLTVASVVLIVVVERARRPLPLWFPDRQAGIRTVPGQTADLALKLNPAGVVPMLLAAWLVSLPTAMGALTEASGRNWSEVMLLAFSYGRPPFLSLDAFSLALYACGILFFVYLYTAFLHDPEQMAATLAKHGGAMPDLRPGESTADRFDHVITRIATLGAAYLALVALLLEFLIAALEAPFYLSGLWLMTVVCVTLDIETQIRAQLARHRAR